MNAIRRLLCLSLVFVSALAQAELTIEITRGRDNPTVIAVVPFVGGQSLPEDLSEIVTNDLYRSGRFSPVPVLDMLSQPRSGEEIYYNEWRALATDYVLIGNIRKADNGELALTVELYDVYRQAKLETFSTQGNWAELRDMAHAVSDVVFQKLTGMRGAFSTKLLYVSGLNNATDAGNQYSYRLMLSDADGARERLLLSSAEPILSPSWSPDAKKIAYVSFESSRPSIYLHDLATDSREQLTSFPGLNSAPAWSPDGSRLAMVLSKGGNPDIYIMDLQTRNLEQITRHYAIDTEPSWTPDGSALVFTSNRGGKPQIYQVTLATKYIERLTFDGNYNARSRVLLDGSGIVMVHRREGDEAFHIALQNVDRGTMKILTETALDESPTVAPNGSMLLYATRFKGQGILAAVSVDGDVKYRLPSKSRDVREPAWSPFVEDHRFFLRNN